MPYIGHRLFFPALLKHKRKGSLRCICNHGWYWPEPYGDQIFILWIAIYLWAHSSPPFQIQQKLLWELLHCAVYATMPFSAGSKLIRVCTGADNPIQFTSSHATVCFETRPSPSNQAIAKAPKGDFFFGLFLDRSKKMKQQSGCPISYSSLTTCRQQEQFLPRVPALDAKKSTTVPENMLCCKKKQQLPFVKKLGYTGICEAMCQQQEKHTYLYLYILHCFSIYRCLKDTAFADYIHAKFSFDRLYPNLSSLASNYLLPTSFLYCFYSILVPTFCLNLKNQHAFSQCSKWYD